MKVVSDVLLLSYLDKIGLSLTVEAGQALAVLYSKARLYKGPSLAGLSQVKKKLNLKKNGSFTFIIFL